MATNPNIIGPFSTLPLAGYLKEIPDTDDYTEIGRASKRYKAADIVTVKASAVNTATVTATGAITADSLTAVTSVAAPSITATSVIASDSISATNQVSGDVLTANTSMGTVTLNATNVNATSVVATTVNGGSNTSVVDNLVTSNDGGASGNVVTFTGTPRTLQDSGIASGSLASSADDGKAGNIVTFTGTAKMLQDSGTNLADLLVSLQPPGVFSLYPIYSAGNQSDTMISLVGPGLGSLTLPANSAVGGTMYKITAYLSSYLYSGKGFSCELHLNDTNILSFSYTNNTGDDQIDIHGLLQAYMTIDTSDNGCTVWSTFTCGNNDGSAPTVAIFRDPGGGPDVFHADIDNTIDLQGALNPVVSEPNAPYIALVHLLVERVF